MTLCSSKISALVKGMASKQHIDCYCLNCLHFLTTENNLGSHKNVCENKYICNMTRTYSQFFFV